MTCHQFVNQLHGSLQGSEKSQASREVVHQLIAGARDSTKNRFPLVG